MRAKSRNWRCCACGTIRQFSSPVPDPGCVSCIGGTMEPIRSLGLLFPTLSEHERRVDGFMRANRGVREG